MILTAHQPNLFPYEGLLDKIRAADLCVLLNHVQFVRGQYQNRFGYGNRWFTMSVNSGRDRIIDKVYVNPEYDWRKIKQQLAAFPLDQFDPDIGPMVAHTNCLVIKRLCGLLGIETPLEVDYSTPLAATERLVDLCRHFGADVYLSGPSGRAYIDERLFIEAGIELRYFEPTGKRAAVELL